MFTLSGILDFLSLYDAWSSFLPFFARFCYISKATLINQEKATRNALYRGKIDDVD